MIQSAGRQAYGVTMPADWERVADDLTAKIKAGNAPYCPGDRLPSIRELADVYDTSLSTVKIALAVLRRERLIRTHPGKGSFVAETDAED